MRVILVTRVRRPYSWLVPYTNFPSTIEVWDRKGAVAKLIAELPMADAVPNEDMLKIAQSFRLLPGT